MDLKRLQMNDLNKLQDAFSLVAEYAEHFQTNASLSFNYDLPSGEWLCFDIHAGELYNAHFCDIDHLIEYIKNIINS